MSLLAAAPPAAPTAAAIAAGATAAAATAAKAAALSSAPLREEDVCAHPMEQFAQWWEQHRATFPAGPDDEGVHEMSISTCSAVTGPPASAAAATANGAADAKAPGAAGAATFPSARMVLLKSFDRDSGFRFYTNYNSRKGQDIAANPHVALLFYWRHLRRQVRVEGVATRCSATQSDAYFHSRHIGSQVNAAVSQQSAVVPTALPAAAAAGAAAGAGAGTAAADPGSGDVKGAREVLAALAAAKTASVPAGSTAIERPAHWGGFDVRPTRVEFWQNGTNRLHDRMRFTLDPKSALWTVERLYP